MAEQHDESWRCFEDAFRAILSQHKDFFGLASVDQQAGQLAGKSGYTWHIEVIAYAKDDGRMVLFECRRKNANLKPSEAGELAFRMEDTGAGRGYFVTTLERGLSEGAKKIADYREIGHIQLSADARPDQYVLRFLSQIFVGITDRVSVTDSFYYELRDKDGNIIQKGI